MQDTIGRKFKVISNLIKRRLVANAIKDGISIPSCDNKSEVTPMQGIIISYLSKHEGEDIYQKDIEQIFTIRRSTATEILKLMANNGLINKLPVKKDARLKKIVLTDKARVMHEKAEAEMLKVEQEMMKGITQEEYEIINKVLDKMKANLESD